MKDPRDPGTMEMNFEAPQDTDSLQATSADSRFPADDSAQVIPSLQNDFADTEVPAATPQVEPSRQSDTAGSEVPAPFFCLDPGTNAGVRFPDGKCVMTRPWKNNRNKETTINTDEAIALLIAQPERGVCRVEAAFLPHATGWTKRHCDILTAAGFAVRICNTRDAFKGVGPETCGNGHVKKPSTRCDSCTERDLNRMASRRENQFYPPHFNRMTSGSKNQSGTAAAELNTALNRARFEPVPYESVSKRMPAWLLEAFGDRMPAATCFLAAEIAVKFGMGVRRFERLLAAHPHARNCHSSSNFRFHYAGDRKMYHKMAEKIFKELRDQ